MGDSKRSQRLLQREVDQLLINVFMLWEHDGYMADDRDVHDLSFLYAKSLYDIRNRSESMLSASKTFLATDRSRIDWILRLERLKTAFNMYDTNGDGSIQRMGPPRRYLERKQ